MKNSKLTRTCIGCRAKKQKNELIRIVNHEGKVQVDIKQNQEGRGAYICKDIKCFEKVEKGNRLKNALKINGNDGNTELIFSKLREVAKKI